MNYLSYAVVENLKTIVSSLSWADLVFGITRIGQVASPDQKFAIVYRYPQTYVGQKVIDIRPDQTRKAILFFEQIAPDRIDYSDEFAKMGTITYSLSVVAWLNLIRIDAAKLYDFTDQCAHELKNKLESYSDLRVDRIDTRPENVFAKYTMNEADKQLLMYPFSGFRIDFSVTKTYVGSSC